MRVSVIAVGKDYGTAWADPRTPDGPWPTNPLTKVQVTDAGGDYRYLRIDGQVIGQIVAIIIDHEDEKPPPIVWHAPKEGGA